MGTTELPENSPPPTGRRKELEPERIRYAKNRLIKLGIPFSFDVGSSWLDIEPATGPEIRYYPYSGMIKTYNPFEVGGWQIIEERGLTNLLNFLKQP